MKRMIRVLMLMGLMVSVGGCGKDGPKRFVEYYENGQVEVEGNRKDGERDGKWVWYDENGKIEAEESYKDGSRRRRMGYGKRAGRRCELCGPASPIGTGWQLLGRAG